MCGICGIYNLEKNRLVAKNILDSMNRVLSHRGPDDSGMYIDGCIGFGQRRLSIIDITQGRQPMCNEDNSIWVTYNGEIYNFKEIKNELEKKGHRFRSDCDTEVIVHCYEEYNTDCISQFNGMFAFALWDNKTATLFLARDRMGVKPLYYSIAGGSFIFASEIKAILKHPGVKSEIEPHAIPEYLFCTTLLNGKTMFKNIFSLPPGCMLTIKNGTMSVTRYWDILLTSPREETGSFKDYTEQTFSFIKDSVRMRMISDVPLGSLLSGGLDSSLVSALASGYINRKLKTFSMEYTGNSVLSKSNSDTAYAWLMAAAFQTEHKEFIFKPEDYQGVLQKVIWHVEKPIELTTPSLFLLYNKLKSDVTVVLSGEGADELFGGYFFFLNGDGKTQLKEFPWAPYFEEVSQLLNPEIENATRFRESVRTTLSDMMNRCRTDDYLNKLLYLFLKLYLLEMLERQDKTSMAWSVEARVPFLDHRLVEYVVNIPSKYKMHGGVEKILLKEIGKGILPGEIAGRKKKPFPFPVDPRTIIRQKNMANDLVQSGNSRISSYFDKKMTDAFFNKRNGFEKLDNLALFRTSYALISLELWHNVFGV
ncbi:MAG: asparagine synthase (glutamine-hydrolyzing) [Spirochaetales bacterium]|nr:asparagine synthase (glutamine-hydrolyzing) [Spirochaetales bacterium]